MPRDHTEECEQLRQALQDASRLVPPQRDTAAPGFSGPVSADPENVTPDASPQLEQEIANLEQRLRDIGCEPD